MKKTKIFLSALVALSILAIITLSVCADPEYTVKYELTGKAGTPFSITYTNETGNRDEINANIPWEKTIIVKGKNTYVGFLATSSSSSASGNYTGKIYVNGKEQASSTGTLVVQVSYMTK